MRTKPAPRCFAFVILPLVTAHGGAMAQEYLDPAETPLGELTEGYAPGSVIYEAPVVYHGPVVYEAPVVYNGPVYYVYRAPEFVNPAPPADPAIGEASTVLVIGGRGGAYGYGHHGDSGQTVIRFGSEGGWFGR